MDCGGATAVNPVGNWPIAGSHMSGALYSRALLLTQVRASRFGSPRMLWLCRAGFTICGMIRHNRMRRANTQSVSQDSPRGGRTAQRTALQVRPYESHRSR